MSLRTRLLLGAGYLLVLAILAFEVPLAHQPRPARPRRGAVAGAQPGRCARGNGFRSARPGGTAWPPGSRAQGREARARAGRRGRCERTRGRRQCGRGASRPAIRPARDRPGARRPRRPADAQQQDTRRPHSRDDRAAPAAGPHHRGGPGHPERGGDRPRRASRRARPRRDRRCRAPARAGRRHDHRPCDHPPDAAPRRTPAAADRSRQPRGPRAGGGQQRAAVAGPHRSTT